MESTTRADRLKALCEKLDATYTRTSDNNIVVLTIDLKNGDRVAGRGPSTEKALENLEERLDGWRL